MLQKGTDMLIDNISLRQFEWTQAVDDELDEKIKKHRTSSSVSFYNQIGLPVNVKLVPLRTFPFGGTLQPVFGEDSSRGGTMRKRWKEIFNYGVFENAHKWKQMEKKEGSIDFDTTDTILDILASWNDENYKVKLP